jgi:hypothetical protein
MFSLEKWKAFYSLFVNDTSMNTFRDTLQSITYPVNAIKGQVSMTLSRLTCGEVKIFLDCCRDLGKMTIEERESLPATLQDRFEFLAAKPKDTMTTQNPSIDHSDKPSQHILNSAQIGNQEVDLMDLCLKCKDLWAVYEAVYWGFRKSDLDLTALEKLDSLIQTSHLK